MYPFNGRYPKFEYLHIMRTKIVYIVVSDEQDCYLEQALVSLWSARVYTPKAHIILVVDQFTSQTLTGKRSAILKYISEKKMVEVPERYSKMQRSRYLKTTLRRNIVGDYLFVDADTIITHSLSDVDALGMDVGAVLDHHIPFSKMQYFKETSKFLLSIGMNPSDTHDMYFNSGVMFVRDVPASHTLYDEWNKIWENGIKVGMNIDQPSLAKANYICGDIIQEIAGIWNSQITNKGIYALNGAYIFHYNGMFHKVPSLLGDIPEDIAENIRCIQDDCRSKRPHIDNDIELLQSNMAIIFRYHKRIFTIWEWIAKVLVQKHL